MTTEKRRQKRLERYAAGKCVTCGKRPPVRWRKQCYQCLEKMKNTLRERRGYIGIPREERADYGMCWHCGEPVIEGMKVCPKCYDRMLAMQYKGCRASRASEKNKERQDAINHSHFAGGRSYDRRTGTEYISAVCT